MGADGRLVSLIASATEIVCALGARERLVGRSHECDHPADVLQLPALTEPKFKVEGSSAEIDARVRAIVRDGLSVYRVDGEALKARNPDIIVTQDHCEVCAVSLSDVEAATCTWTGRSVEIVSLKPDSMADAYADIGVAGFFGNMVETYGALLTESAILPRAEIDAWRTEQTQAMADGTFFGASNYYTYLARRPAS